MFETLERIFPIIVRYGILIFEMVGVLILIAAALHALANLFKDRQHGKLVLYEGISTALTFLLGSEVLKTIIAPDWQEVGMTCAVLLMRAGMAVLIHWEKKHEGGHGA